MPWGQGPAWGQFGAPGWGGLSTLPNSVLDRLSVVWCLDLYLEASFPWKFPVHLDAAPLRVSTLDLYPGDVLGNVLYEGRILEKPTLRRQTPDPFGGLLEVDSLSVKLSAQDVTGSVNLHDWVAAEHRGKVVIGHLVELESDFTASLVMQNIFRGEVLAMADDPGTVSVVARAFDMNSLIDTVPAATVQTSWAPYAPSGSLGQVINKGTGIGRRIPCVCVKARTEDNSLFEQTFTADSTTDTLNIPGHDFETGEGPYRVSSTGTLPGGLSATLDYWLIAVDGDNIRLATTRGNALTAVAINLTSNGSGTRTLRAGLAPNFDDDYDLVVGEGNLGIIRVWEDASAQGSGADAIPDAPFTFDILHRTYKPDGARAYATAIRFHDQFDGTEITADVLGIYPEVDTGVVAEWKWLLGFRDDVGGNDAISDPSKIDVTSTADLKGTHQGYGLGSVQLDVTKGLIVPTITGDVFALQSFTVEVECFPNIGATGGFHPLVRSPQWEPDTKGWYIYYNPATQAPGIYMEFEDGSQLFYEATAGSMPRGRPALVALRRDGTAGLTEVWLNGDQIGSDTRASAIRYGSEPHNPLALGCLPADVSDGFYGRLGWVRLSDTYRGNRYLERAYALWRRNGIEWCRELAESVGRPYNATMFDTAAADWDAVEAGSLRCDGYLTEFNELRAVLQSMVPFRDLRFDIGLDGRLEVTVAQPPSEIKAQFGHGDGYFENLLSLPTRTRASLTEATQKLLVHFRRPRNGSEPFGGYEREVERAVFSVGSPGTVLEMPFIDSAETADIVADFAAKRRVTRDEIIDVEVGHEGRDLDLGDLFGVTAPEMSIATTLEALVISKGAERNEIRGVPVNAADFVYTPMPLPADPADRTLRTTDLGNSQFLVATYASGLVLLTLNLQNVQTLLPVGDGLPGQNTFPTLVGAATHWQAVATGDDATSYVRSAPGRAQVELFKLPPLTSDGIVASIFLTMRMRKGGTSDVTLYPILEITGAGDAGGTVFSNISFTVNNSGTFANYSRSWTADPRTFKAWTVAQINGMEIGCFVSAADMVDITLVALQVSQVIDEPPFGGFVRYWQAGPSPTLPPTPAETDPSVATEESFAAPTIALSGSTGEKYWYWARVYDEFGRAIALIQADNPVTVGP